MLQWVYNLGWPDDNSLRNRATNDLQTDSNEENSATNDLPANDLRADSNLFEEANYTIGLKIEEVENLSPEIVELIEKDLSDDEKVSIIFLIDDLTDHALQTLRIAIKNRLSQARPVSEWARAKEKNWKYKLLEALVVLQNFEVIEKLGFKACDVRLFFNYEKGSKYIDRIRKELYLLCEYLDEHEADHLIERVKQKMNDTDEKKIQHFHKFVTAEESNFLEIWLLQMLSFRFIINEDAYILMKPLTSILKLMDKLDKAEELDFVVREVVEQRTEYLYEKDSLRYPIKDPDRLGLCIVLNQYTFDQNPSNLMKLADREGTQKDVAALERTFKDNLKMKFVTLNNLYCDKILPIIKAKIRAEFEYCHSMVFLFVLSHGNKGCIYGTDCVPLDLNSLEDCLTECKKLKGIPKVLVIQACQNELVEIVEPDIVSDGPSDKSDFFKCMATLPGLKAVRSMSEGTWYVQELCKAIDQYKDTMHFSDIVIRVHREIKKKLSEHFKDNCDPMMIPNQTITSTRFLYFHSKKSTV